ncbi:hypothetical protein N665_0355s0008 [Sinapis alba]|nr:hypothetical protein N665_0355s0008 [Sinapis alba]
MCNIGVHFDKSTNTAGGGWVLRSDRGVVLFHSRRSFAGINSKDEAKFEVLLWAAESMRSQRQTKIVFAGEFEDLFGAIQRPEAWPSFLFQGTEIRKELMGVAEFETMAVNRRTNRGAFFIAQSVTKLGLVNSYVATGSPSWLLDFFVNESRPL